MKSAHPALQIAVAALLISVPVTIGIILLEASSDGTLPQPTWWVQQYLYVVVVSAILTTGGWALDRLQAKATLDASPATAPAAFPFADRLPVKLRAGIIYAVSAEDHYLRLHTSKGQDLILMRLSDAVAELEGIEGAQTHRSWWVARGAVEDTRRTDGRAVLTLTGGVEAPVSRAYAKALREAGWF